MTKTSFEKLDVYRLSERLADTIWSIVSNWESFPKRTLGSQIVNSSDSVCANIAEGCGRYSYRDNVKFIKIARGSLYETKNWLRRAYLRGLLDPEEVRILSDVLDELLPKLNAYKKAVERLVSEKQ